MIDSDHDGNPSKESVDGFDHPQEMNSGDKGIPIWLSLQRPVTRTVPGNLISSNWFTGWILS